MGGKYLPRAPVKDERAGAVDGSQRTRPSVEPGRLPKIFLLPALETSNATYKNTGPIEELEEWPVEK